MYKISITSILVLLIGISISANSSITVKDADLQTSSTESVSPTLIQYLSEAQIKLLDPCAGQMVFNTSNQKLYSYSHTLGLWIEVIETKLAASHSFSCGSVLVDSRDGQSYQTVQIGNQCWMSENLNVGARIDGDQNQSDNSKIEKYCYDDNASNCKSYGGLYQWDEMMNYSNKTTTKGICPTGWHIPSDEEWKKMELQLGMSHNDVNEVAWRGTNQGNQLKGENNSVLWGSNMSSQSNFNALPGGYRYRDGDFNSVEINTVFWSSSEDGSDAINRYLFSNYEKEGRNYFDKSYGFSIRCIKN